MSDEELANGTVKWTWENALTAEREALEQDNHRWKMECENFWRDREKALTAERDRLRRGIEYILDGYGLAGPDYRFPYGEEESDWITDHLIAVLKGETP